MAASLGRISLERNGLTRYATTPASRALSISVRWLNAVSRTTTVFDPLQFARHFNAVQARAS
jgi:hypothetical protein